LEPSSTSSKEEDINVALDFPNKKVNVEESESVDVLDLDSTTMKELANILYLNGNATVEVDDMTRWCSQGFEFSKSLPEFQFGLKQGLGGPCGVLAAVQAEMLALIFFNDKNKDDEEGKECNEGTGVGKNDGEMFPVFSSKKLHEIFAQALVEILIRSTKEGNFIKLVSFTGSGLFKGFQNQISNQLKIHNFQNQSRESIIEFITNNIEMYSAHHGCILFLIGLLLTRGLEQINSDMDMDDTTLIGQFGHCTQELVNLLLTGRATGNVMDGDVPMGDSGLTVRGVKKQSHIGYLTHLEALSMCQVGSFYKIPEVPVWVVGSSSHFTVLFCTDKKVNEESDSEKLRTKVQRAFKSVDMDECGFISTDKVSLALMNIDEPIIYEILGDEDDIGRLRGHMTSDGDIVIYGTFWETVSRLVCTGATLDDLIDDKAKMDAAVIVAMQDDNQTQSGSSLVRSDSDLARELQRQFDDPDGGAMMGTDNTFNGVTLAVPAPAESTGSIPRTDSELARALQDEWNASDNDNMPQLISMPPPVPASEPTNMDDTFTASTVSTASASDNTSGQSENTQKEDVVSAPDSSFSLYHYNGLENSTRPARLSHFIIRRREEENITGQSVAYSGGNGGTAYLNPLEEVVRTRWVGCSLDFGAQSPPSID